MTGTNKGIVLRLLHGLVVTGALLMTGSAYVYAEPLLLVYPNSPTTFRYNVAQYTVLHPADPNYDPAYHVGDGMLWNTQEGRIPYEVYRAPALIGFEPSPSGMNEFYTQDNEFLVYVDGFSEYPRQLANLYLRIIPEPPYSTVSVLIDGAPLDALITPIPGFTVDTETPDGHYADRRQFHIRWSAAIAMRITCYADKNGNRVYDGGVPAFSIYVEDNTVPARETTWGRVKALYADE